MSNNKQSMKLYTEEQVEIAMAYVHAYHESDTRLKDEEILKKLTPIELPSDDEIHEMGKDVIIYNDTKRGWFIEGLKFMRDKIGGNK